MTHQSIKERAITEKKLTFVKAMDIRYTGLPMYRQYTEEIANHMGKRKTFNRNDDNECLISSSELISILTTDISHGYGYYHLTKWSSLCKMMEPVIVPDEKVAHRMLHVGAAFNMNDENDKGCGKRIYFTSFSFGPPENISMWTNYGIPNEEAVRIKIPENGMLRWIEDFKEGKVGVYGVDSDGSLNPLSAKAQLKMVDVAYWSKKEVGKNADDPNEGLFYYNYDKYRLNDGTDVNQLMKGWPYLFKEFGWNYERETRLVLEFDEDLADRYKRVAVPFDYPLHIIDVSFSKLVMQGPWDSSKEMLETNAAGHSLSEAKQSRYKGLVKMRSVCDSCPEQDKETCKCKYKGQR